MGWPWVDLLDHRVESAVKKVRSKFHTKILVVSALRKMRSEFNADFFISLTEYRRVALLGICTWHKISTVRAYYTSLCRISGT